MVDGRRQPQNDAPVRPPVSGTNPSPVAFHGTFAATRTSVRSMSNRLILSTLLAAFFAALVPAMQPAAAQLYQPRHRPVDVRYRHFETDHFGMIYQRGLEGAARDMADLLEGTLPEIRARVGLRRTLRVPVVLNRYTDRANGYVTVQPFRQEIDVVPLRGHVLSPRLRDWFETVGPHELAHAAHAESGRGIGIGWLLRRLGPDLARSLNLSGPRGINEGLAVWIESRLRPNAGRLSHSFFDMEFRAAMDSGDPWSLAQMLEAPAYTRPFDRYYHGGAHLFQYLESSGDVAFFRRARNFYYRMPLFGYGPALWYGTGRRPSALGREMRRTFRRRGAAFLDSLGEMTPLRTVSTQRGTVHRRPKWLDDRTLLTYARGYHLRPGFYRVDLHTGRRRLVAVESITEDMMFTLDESRSAVLFSRYVVDPLEPLRASADVFRLDIERRRTERATVNGRLFAPVRSGDGSTWALRNVDRFNEWVQLGGSGAAVVLGALDSTQLLAVEPDPASEQVAVLANHEGRQGVYRAEIRNGEIASFTPWLQFADASIYDISWSPHGAYLLFSADPGGVVNVFGWQRAGDRVYQLTNVPYGAFEPALSPDHSSIAFIHYRHERYDIAVVPFDLSTAREWPREDVRQFPTVPDLAVPRPAVLALAAQAPSDRATADQVSSDPALVVPLQGSELPACEAELATAFQPIRHVRPRVLYPLVVIPRPTGNEEDVHLGPGVGVGVEWSDPLQYWTAQTSVFHQAGALWGTALLRSGAYLLRPSVELFRKPSTVTVRRTVQQRVDTVRIGKEEQGVGAAVRLPAVLESNVFSTTAAGEVGVEYRSERLFGRGGETLRPPERRLTLRPSASLAIRMQANARDLQPNSGLAISARSAIDLWSEAPDGSTWLRGDADLYVPFLKSSSTAVKLIGSVLAQNRGGLLDLMRFLPRGYETDNVFLGRGTFIKSGLEITRPLWYVDDGFLFPPVFLKAVFAYGFVESLDGGRAGRPTTAGVGLGMLLRLFHGLDVTLRMAPVYRFDSSDWQVTFR